MSTLADRLLSKYIVLDNGCWLYTGGWNSGGYGNIWDNGTTRSAHVVSFEIHKGPVPAGMSVLHTCDNRPCINPDHLFAGTTQDNIDDMVTKGRDGFKGVRNGRALLEEDDVRAIKGLMDYGVTQQFLADWYKVSKPTISAISTGRNWGDV